MQEKNVFPRKATIGMTARKFGKWLRRFGYLTFVISLLWIFLYTQLVSHLFQSDNKDDALQALYICRSISDVLAKISIGAIIFGVIIGVTQRFGKKKESDIGEVGEDKSQADKNGETK